MADFGEDAGGFDFDFALHAEDLEEDFDAFLGREDLGNEGAEAGEWAFEQLHFFADLNDGRNFDGFLIDHGGAEVGDDLVGNDGGDSAEADDGAHAERALDMAVLGAVVEVGENIAGEHGLGDLHLAAAPGPLEPDHRAEDLNADIAHEHPAGGRFAAGLGFHTEPPEFFVFEMRHGLNFGNGLAAGKCGLFRGQKKTHPTGAGCVLHLAGKPTARN